MGCSNPSGKDMTCSIPSIFIVILAKKICSKKSLSDLKKNKLSDLSPKKISESFDENWQNDWSFSKLG